MEYLIVPVDSNASLITPAENSDKIDDIAGVIPVFKSYKGAAAWYNDRVEVISRKAIAVK